MILIGLGLLIIGIAMVIFAQNVFNFTGSIDFIENKFPGNTKNFIQLTGIVATLLGMLFVTGLGSWLTEPIGGTLNNLFGGI